MGDSDVMAPVSMRDAQAAAEMYTNEILDDLPREKKDLLVSDPVFVSLSVAFGALEMELLFGEAQTRAADEIETSRNRVRDAINTRVEELLNE